MSEIVFLVEEALEGGLRLVPSDSQSSRRQIVSMIYGSKYGTPCAFTSMKASPRA